MCNNVDWGIIHYSNRKKLSIQPNKIYIKIYQNHIVKMALINDPFFRRVFNNKKTLIIY